MGEITEGTPLPQETSRMRFEGSLGRDLKLIGLEQKALDLSWVKGMTSTKIEFPQPNGKLVRAVELEIPFNFEGIKDIYQQCFKRLVEENNLQVTDDEIQKSIDRNSNTTWFNDLKKFNIPDRIKKIKIVDFSPQEGLPRKQRSIDSKRDWQHEFFGNRYLINKLTDQPSEGKIVDRAMWIFGMRSRSAQQRADAMHDLFYDVFGEDRNGLEKFKNIVEQTGGDEIIMIHGHGGHDNRIGEQGWEVKGEDAKVLAKGNRINLSQIIEEYDHPEKYAAILITSCYFGDENPPEKRVRVFRPRGTTHSDGSGSFIGPNRNKLLISRHE